MGDVEAYGTVKGDSALRRGGSLDLVARLTAGTGRKVRCTVFSGRGFVAGKQISVTPDQLLVKVWSK